MICNGRMSGYKLTQCFMFNVYLSGAAKYLQLLVIKVLINKPREEKNANVPDIKNV